MNLNLNPMLSVRKRFLVSRFCSLRVRALTDMFEAMRTRTNSSLDVFPGTEQPLSPGLMRIGIRKIRVAEIAGTFERNTDFDNQFRPLQWEAKNRWIDTYIQQSRWEPILVHQVGDQYFVEAGHYRVSVARFTGMEFIEAEVWEYSCQTETAEVCYDWPCPERCTANAYAAG